MRRRSRATAWAATLFASLAVTLSLLSSSHAADLIWEVENPFRFFKPTKSFALHEAAFTAVRGDPSAPLPTNVIWRTERQLNDPDCKDASHPDRCAATAGKRYQQSRLGWAAQTLGETCYESNGRPRRYSPVCERKYSWGTAKEDYVLPEAHTVAIRIAPEQLANVTGDCTWSWQPRKAGGKPESNKIETKKLACKDKLTIARVPYAQDRANSGVSVAVKLPDGLELAERDVVVEDTLHRGAGRFLCLGRKQPRQAGAIQPVAGDGVRSDPAARASRGKDAGQERRAEHVRLWARLQRRPVQSESVAAPPDGRRGGGTLPQAGFARIRCRLRQGGRALAEPRLSPVAIRLSVPRGDRARAGEPSSLGDARELDLLRCHGGRRPVARHGAARGRERRFWAARSLPS